MDVSNLIDSVLDLPQIRRLLLPPEKGGLGYTFEQLSEMVKGRAKDAINEVIIAYPWDFAISDSTFNTANGTATYKLTGADNNALSIYYMYNTTTGKKVEEITRNYSNQLRNDYSSLIESRYWYKNGRAGGYPMVTIMGTPTKTENITYQYWRSDIEIGDMSEDFNVVLVESLAKYFASSRYKDYDTALTKLIAGYDKGSARVDIAELDPQIKLNNQMRNSLNGW